MSLIASGQVFSWLGFSSHKLVTTLMAIGIASLFAVIGSDAAAQTNADQFWNRWQARQDATDLVAGLRQRRLFDTAEAFCQREIAAAEDDPTLQAVLLIELMKTQTSQAILANQANRDSGWARVEATAEQFYNRYPQHPRKLLVQVQQALAHLARGQLLRQEIAAEIAPPEARDMALQEYRLASEQLKGLQRAVTKQLPEARGRQASDHELTPAQLLTLNSNIRFQLAVVDLGRSQLYDVDDRLNRFDALSGLEVQLLAVQREVASGEPLWWQTKAAQLECYRLLDRAGEAKLMLADLPTSDIPPAIESELLEQKIRLAIDLGDEAFAASVLAEVEQFSNADASLDLAAVEFALDLANRSLTDPDKKRWIARASQWTEVIKEKHGAYWGRRADLAMIRAVGGAVAGNLLAEQTPTGMNPDGTTRRTPSPTPRTGSTNVELLQLQRVGDQAYRNRQFADAVKAYRAGAAKAKQLGDAPLTLNLQIQLAQSLEQLGEHGEAGQLLVLAAKEFAESTLASAAHLRGCWNLAQAVQQTSPEDQAAQAAATSLFEEALLEHLETWSRQPSADQVRIWLAGVEQAKQQWQPSFDLLSRIGPESPQFAAAMEPSRRAAMMILAEVESNSSTTATVCQRLLAVWKQQLERTDAGPLVTMKLELNIAELDLLYGSRLPSEALLARCGAIQTAITSDAEPQETQELAWQAQALELVAIGFNDLERAKGQAKQWQAPLAWLQRADQVIAGVLGGLAGQANAGDHSQRLDDLRRLRVSLATNAIERAARDSDAKAAASAWRLRRAEVFSELQLFAEAIGDLKKLRNEFPNNAGVQIALAQAMTRQWRARPDSSSEVGVDEPLNQWRSIANRVKSHTETWYESKFQVASLLVEAGRKTEANKFLKYLKTIPPGWEDSARKLDFERLLKFSE